MAFETIDYATANGIATIVLARPERLNAFNSAMAMELVAAFDQADSDDSVRVVVVTGKGRGFCSGADLSGGKDSFDLNHRGAGEFGEVNGVARDRGGFVSLRIAASRKFVIGAINGPAVGIGATLTLPMDVRIADETARFGFVFSRRGIVPEAASSWFLPRVVGVSQAMEWVATGRIFDAHEARNAGLVSRVVAAGSAVDAAYELAEEIAANAPLSLAVTRQLMWTMLEDGSSWQAHALESQLLADLGGGADAKEGVSAFLEKREPRFAASVCDEYPNYLKPWPTANIRNDAIVEGDER